MPKNSLFSFAGVVMEVQQILNFLLSIIVLLMGGIMRSYSNKLDKMANDLNAHIIDSAKTYAPIALISELRREIKQDMQEIKDMSVRIEDKLDKKADK